MAACGLLSVACVNQVEEVFDTKASERLEQTMLECQSLLTSAEYGWMIEYYPDSNQSYGGSTYAAKFENNGDVTVTGEVAQEISGDVSKTITSHYSINSSSSVVLTFDTYNEYIHYWSDPDDYSGNVYDGDFEFAFESGNAEEMIFRGIKTGNRIVFTALDTDIVTCVQQIVAIQNEVVDNLYLGYRWDDGNSTGIELYDDDNYNLLAYYPDGDTSGAYETIPYSYTSEGIGFYQPATINGITVQNFKWENNTFVSTDAVDASGTPVNVALSGFHCDNFMHYDTFIGSYLLKYGSTEVPVTLTEKVRYSSYTLSGLGDYDLTIGYSKSDATLSLCSQYIGTYGSYYIWCCPWDADSGYLTWTTTVGFTLSHNADPDNLVLTFADNGVWGSYTANSILYYEFTAISGGSTVGPYARYAYIETMTKQ